VLLNNLFVEFNNIYSIPILLLFYDDTILNEYYYLHANILYDKYNILLKLKYDKLCLSSKLTEPFKRNYNNTNAKRSP
jgi:hypothetical protein